METIAGQPMIDRVIDAVRRVKTCANYAVITSDSPVDDDLIEHLKTKGVTTFRGPERDVLQRYILAASHFGAEEIVRINSDCPFIDPALIDSVITEYRQAKPPYDYVSTILEETFPTGMHVEIFSMSALVRSSQLAKDDEREHVTAAIYNNPSKFSLLSVRNNIPMPIYRLTVDYEEDLVFSDRLASVLNSRGVDRFNCLAEIHEVMEESPDFASLNQHISKTQRL